MALGILQVSLLWSLWGCTELSSNVCFLEPARTRAINPQTWEKSHGQAWHLRVTCLSWGSLHNFDVGPAQRPSPCLYLPLSPRPAVQGLHECMGWASAQEGPAATLPARNPLWDQHLSGSTQPSGEGLALGCGAPSSQEALRHEELSIHIARMFFFFSEKVKTEMPSLFSLWENIPFMCNWQGGKFEIPSPLPN